MMRIARLFGIAILPISAAVAQSRLPTPQILVDVPIAPTPFERDSKLNLAYEVHLTNLAQSIMLLEKLEVLDQTGSVVATFDAPALATMMARPIPALKLVDPKMIESGK
jgi:hypothetical protein